jgi:hypothetical protein
LHDKQQYNCDVKLHAALCYQIDDVNMHSCHCQRYVTVSQADICGSAVTAYKTGMQFGSATHILQQF